MGTPAAPCSNSIVSSIKSATFLAAGSWSKAKEAGQVRLEGKDHVIDDGDIVHVRFAV